MRTIKRDILTINGVAVADPKAGGIQITDNLMWADGAGRSTNGNWIGDIKGWKTQITVSWGPLPFSEVKRIRDAVKAGGDRQELHERIRELSMEAGKNVKVEGKDNNLLELIAADPAFHMSLEDLQKSMDPAKYVGCSAHQVEKFLDEVVKPILDQNKDELGVKAEINV